MTQPSPPPPGPARSPRTGRLLLLGGLAAIVVVALVLSVLAVVVVTRLLGGGGEEAAPEAPTYVAPSPMTRVRTEHFSFSHPEHWQVLDDDASDEEGMDYLLDLTDAADNSQAVVMDFAVEVSVAATCEDLSNAGGRPYEERPEVQIDGRPALHYRSTGEGEDGRMRVRDLWCTERGPNILVVLGATSGPEAEAAGVSEAQKLLDTWQWAEDEEG